MTLDASRRREPLLTEVTGVGPFSTVTTPVYLQSVRPGKPHLARAAAERLVVGMRLHMRHQNAPLSELPLANAATILGQPAAAVGQPVVGQGAGLGERSPAVGTRIRPMSRMGPKMLFQAVRAVEPRRARVAREPPLAVVADRVNGKVLAQTAGPAEPAPADQTRERAVAAVRRSPVVRQVARLGEPPLAQVARELAHAVVGLHVSLHSVYVHGLVADDALQSTTSVNVVRRHAAAAGTVAATVCVQSQNVVFNIRFMYVLHLEFVFCTIIIIIILLYYARRQHHTATLQIQC